jgi:hypothetical protein
VTDGDNVYFGSTDRYLYSVDGSSGNRNWRYEAIGEVVSEPAVSDGTVYFSSGGYTYAVSDGDEVWTHSEGAGPASPTTVSLGTVYVTKSRRVFALDSEDGSVFWSYRLGTDSTSKPAFDEDRGNIYVAGDNEVVALDATDGSELWTSTEIDVDGGVAIGDDGRLHVAGRRGTVAVLNGDDGSTVAKTETRGRFADSPTLAVGRVYLGSLDGGVYAFDDEDLSLDWEYGTGSAVNGSVGAAGDAVYVAEGSRLHCLDASSGEEIWTKDVGDSLHSPSVDGSYVYAGCRDDALYGFEGTRSLLGDDLRILSASLEDESVGPGEEFRATVEVENRGGSSGEIELEMRRDGGLAATETVSVPGGESQIVTLSGSANEVITGEFEVTVNGDQVGTVRIGEEREENETESDDVVTQNTTGSQNGNDTDTRNGTTDENKTGGSDGGQSLPGFGFLAGAAGVAGVLAARLCGSGDGE